MKRDTIIHIFLSILICGSTWIGYELGSSEKKEVFDTMTLLLESERNLEVIQNIKALEGLKEGSLDITVYFLQARVKAALKTDGIEETTAAKAKNFQKQYCDDPCLGIDE